MQNMKMVLQVLVHTDADGSLWAEVPSLLGCYTVGNSLDEIETNARGAVLAYLGEPVPVQPEVKVLEITL